MAEEFRQKFARSLRYANNHAVLLDRDLATLEPSLKHCVAAALTYHLRT